MPVPADVGELFGAPVPRVRQWRLEAHRNHRPLPAGGGRAAADPEEARRELEQLVAEPESASAGRGR